jgi:[ribosomal protein S18]-alanine N-acetyltransferase
MSVDAIVRDAVRADLGAIVAIERACFSDPWTRGMFAPHLDAGNGSAFVVAEDRGTVIGYAMTLTVTDEAELLNIAVDVDRRGSGIGALLLDEVMRRARAAGALDMWLEVRASNTAARTLYDSRGFVAVGVRKRYYHAPREDAIVLQADLRVGKELVPEPAAGLSAGRDDSILSPARHFPRQETK